MIKLCTFFFVFAHSILFAQNYSNTSNFVYSTEQTTTISANEVSTQLNYAKSIFKDSLVESLNIVEQNLKLAIQYGYKYEEALAHKILGEFNLSLDNLNISINHLMKANQIYLHLKDHSSSFEIFNLLGHTYSKKNESVLAIKNWLNAEETYGISQTNMIQMHLKVGDEYLKLKRFDKAKVSFNKALTMSKELDRKEDIITSSIGLGKVEEMTGANDEAEELFQFANTEATLMNSMELTNSSLNSLSDFYQNSNNTEQTILIQKKAIDFNTSMGNEELAIQNSTKMANTLIESGEDEEAIKMLNQSVNIIKKNTNSEIKRNFYKTLSKAYEANGDIQKSKELEKEYIILMDSFKLLEQQKHELIVTKNGIIQNTENKINLLEKDRLINQKTIQLLKQEQTIKDKSLKNQQIIMLLLILGLLLIGTVVFFIIRSNKQKQKNNQLLTLKSLRNQMNPHFIFNSLNSVNAYIAQQDERAANKYLSNFSKLMRAVLNYSQNDFILLSKELEILHLYLGLEHDRFKDYFDYTIDCPQHIDLEKYQIPPMLIQPIVENAIWHGLRYKSEKGYLNIRFSEENNDIRITITDNGIGREKSLLYKTTNQLNMKSTGIKNVKDRLEIIKTAFKKELSIEINDLNLETKEGTVVTILLKA